MATKDNKSKTLETILVLVGAFVICFWIWEKKIFLLIAIILILAGVFSPYLANKISWLWLKFAELIGSVMSKVLLSLVFFIFLLPLAVMYRITNKNFLSLKKKPGSYYVERNHQYTAKDIENIW
jgi:uncharacterized membrane protein (UPF0182 family)